MHAGGAALSPLTGRPGQPSVTSKESAGSVLLIVMYEAQTWRVRPGEPFSFGRAPECSAVLPAADLGVSRTAGSFHFHDRWWWLHNDSSSCVLCLLGDRGFRVDLPPGQLSSTEPGFRVYADPAGHPFCLEWK